MIQPIVVAHVTLRKRDGSSLLDSNAPITAETIAHYRVEEAVIQEAKAKFEALGFSVEGEGALVLRPQASKRFLNKPFRRCWQRAIVTRVSEALALLKAKALPPLAPSRFPSISRRWWPMSRCLFSLTYSPEVMV
jgi:hypothetical protein